MTKITLMEILEQESLSTESILNELYLRGTVKIHTDDLVDVVTSYANQLSPLKLLSLGSSMVSISV